ncbi:Cell Wall Hydrolase [compost metagenome]
MPAKQCGSRASSLQGWRQITRRTGLISKWNDFAAMLSIQTGQSPSVRDTPMKVTAMRLFRIATCLAALFLSIPALAADPQQKAETALDKAEVLEQAAKDGAVPPPSGEAITRSEARAVDPAGAAPLDDPITCLARSIYWEAKGAPARDMEAVASVVMNRLEHEGFPRTVCGVVKQGSERGACQFSWWCDGRPDRVVEDDRYSLATDVARKALNQQLRDRTGGALYFHDRNVHPAWADRYLRTAQSGRFLFYKPRNGMAR